MFMEEMQRNQNKFVARLLAMGIHSEGFRHAIPNSVGLEHKRFRPATVKRIVRNLAAHHFGKDAPRFQWTRVTREPIVPRFHPLNWSRRIRSSLYSRKVKDIRFGRNQRVMSVALSHKYLDPLTIRLMVRDVLENHLHGGGISYEFAIQPKPKRLLVRFYEKARG